jgi:hypothetical protein
MVSTAARASAREHRRQYCHIHMVCAVIRNRFNSAVPAAEKAITEARMSEIASPGQRGRPRGRPFVKGRSGNPAGRRRAGRNQATLAAEILLEGQSKALTQKAVERALAGNDFALKICLDRILAPRRDRAVRFSLPPIESAADRAAALGAVAAAVAKGALTPGEASDLSQVAATFIRAIETADFERRLQAIEERNASRP